MEGNHTIDTLMLPVLDTIRHYVKEEDAIRDIYNRAYEAIQNSMDAKEMIVYVVTMYRNGNRESHSYPLGVFSDYDFARRFGQDEEYIRGGKYKLDITTWKIDHPVIEFESEEK